MSDHDGLELVITIVWNSHSGAVYVFRAKRADRIKLVFWDGTGLCLHLLQLQLRVLAPVTS
ncbi:MULTISPECIES: IS66 family insertion sequence element accessory protein TnpB [unclassified Bradyrhizobium]|uniref:IS66 family insertion sequence element accessory protein TnpB n=1 Tax=unclassified Bradyrhizobium TaxID=2631580 RepID=UPI0035C70C91